MTSSTSLHTSVLLCLLVQLNAPCSHAANEPLLPQNNTATSTWFIGQSIDPYTGQRYPYASLITTTTNQPSAVVLNLLCSRYQTFVNLYWGQPLSGETIRVRYTPSHTLQSTEESWIVSKDHTTLLYPHDGNTLFSDLLMAPLLH